MGNLEEQNLIGRNEVEVSKRCPWASKMYERRKWRYMMYLLASTFIFGVVYLGYFCEDRVCALTPGVPTPRYKSQLDAYLEGRVLHEAFENNDLDRSYDFDANGNEVIVFLHIQKTGGTTFGRHLVKDLNIPCQCFSGKKRCDCENGNKQTWLFSRYSVGWPCGLHADWTELQSCADTVLEDRDPLPRSRRYLYITILRDPLYRFLSEWKHVARGSTWISAKLQCNGREATLEEVPFCFQDEDWSGVSLDEFMGCPHNLAINRQTRMLANLSLVGCYNRSVMSQAERDRQMLQSAKDNLKNMAFFGLTEFQEDTQYMFEHTFELKFLTDFEQHNRTHAQQTDMVEAQRRRILELNKLDIELYQYAKDLFLQRLRRMREEVDKTRTRSQGGGGQRVGKNSQYRSSNGDSYNEELDENYEDDDDEKGGS